MNPAGDPASLDVFELVQATAKTTTQLVEKQVALLRAELGVMLIKERNRAIFVGTGAAIALTGLSLLLTAAVLAIGSVTGHVALVALIGGVSILALCGGAIGYGLRKHREAVLPATRKMIDEEVEWAQEKLHEVKSTTSLETSSASNGVAKS